MQPDHPVFSEEFRDALLRDLYQGGTLVAIPPIPAALRDLVAPDGQPVGGVSPDENR